MQRERDNDVIKTQGLLMFKVPRLSQQGKDRKSCK